MNDLPKTMKGVWLTGHGELDKLDVRSDIPVPKPTANDVLIRVGAAAVTTQISIHELHGIQKAM